MELIQETSPLIDLYTAMDDSFRFSFVDVGCSGGIDPVFLKLDGKLRALAIDASVDEIERLIRKKGDPRIKYIAGLVGLPADHPFRQTLGKEPYWHNVPFERLSVFRSISIRDNNKRYRNHKAKFLDNQWRKTRLSDKTLVLSDCLAEEGFSDVDLLKIDIDGPDFMALQSLDDRFGKFGVLAVCMEVNFIGSDSPTDHSFHNTDRFMRKNGYDLFGLTVRPYSAAALPFRYQLNQPSQTIGGRPFQGDALYVKDFCAADKGMAGDLLPAPEKLVNAALVFSLFGLPDHAAELIISFRPVLEKYLDITVWLDALTRQSLDMQHISSNDIASYADLLQKFNNDDPWFYDAVRDSASGPNFVAPKRKSKSFWRNLRRHIGLAGRE